MPFTPSHAAAVLPFVGRRGLVPAALVIGSMAPDLPYFLLLGTEPGLTHSVLGVFTVDLLMALAVYVLWQGVVAPAAYAAAPAAFRARALPPAALASRFGSLSAAATVALSLVVGGLTHIAWDAFTHEGRWGAEAIPQLTQSYGRFVGYRWAQYASSALGLALAGAYLVWWWVRTPVRNRPTPGMTNRGAVMFWAVVGGALCLGGAAGIISALAGDVDWRRGVFRAIVWGGSAGMTMIFVASAIAAGHYSRWSGEPPAVSDEPSAT